MPPAYPIDDEGMKGFPVRPTYVVHSVDPIAGVLIVNAFEHSKVHDGEMGHAYYLTPQGSLLGNDENLDFVIQVGDVPIHMLHDVLGGGDAEIHLYEGAGFTSTGTVIPIHNMNRVSSKVPTWTARLNPGVTGSARQLASTWLPGGSFLAPGGQVERSKEFILSPNTNYLVRITNRSGQNNPFAINVFAYRGGPIE